MTQEQELLLRKAQERVQLARFLVSQSIDLQAATDSIAHHAYYAMLHTADAFLRGEGITRNSHGAIIAAFGEHFAKPQRLPPILHRYLIAAKQIRESADYGIEPTVTLLDAKEHLTHAMEFLELARKHLGTSQD